MAIGGQGNDLLDGGIGGFDRASWYKNFAGVTADLDENGAGIAVSDNGDVDIFSNLEGLEGSYYDDRLYGNAGNNLLEALFGDDLLDGEGGNDRLEGKIGNDRFIGGSGDDDLIGDGGFDVAIYSGVRSDYLISSSEGDNVIVTDLNPFDGDDGVDALEYCGVYTICRPDA